MRRTLLHPVFFVAATALLASKLVACSTPAQPSKTIQVTEADDKGTVSLNVGDTLQVTLQGNPTTGYQWEVSSVDTSILKSSGEPGFTPASPAVGSGGNIVFLFDAIAAGQTTLKMAYQRPFEKNVPPVQTFTLSVTVR
jgi:inhibitor of cysteine peptidase